MQWLILFLFLLFFQLVQFSKQYEVGGPYNTGAGGGTADYAFMLLFGMLFMCVTYIPIVLMVPSLPPLFSQSLIYYVLYVWSRRNPTSNANIWGIPVVGNYLPFAYLALTVVMGQPFKSMIFGMVAGHFYYFLVDVYPQVNGKDILHTPQFLVDYFGIGEYQAPAQPQQPAPNADPAAGGRAVGGGGGAAAAGGGGGHNWGTGGHALGRG
jgi:Derlin-2/3